MKFARTGLRFCLMAVAGVLLMAAAKPAAGAGDDSTPGKIDGIPINRPDGTFLGLELKDNNFVLSFYNAKKKKVAPDVASALIRWPVKYQPQEERTTLVPGADGTSLTSPRFVRPPHSFRVFLLLFAAGKQDAVETYTFDFYE